VPAIYFDPSKFPGHTVPALPKGETECKAIGSRSKGGQLIAVTTTIIVFSGPSRAGFDASWSAYAQSGTPVTGLAADAAVFDAPYFSIFGYRGGDAFEVTIEPYPLTLFATSKVLAIDTALATPLLAHVG
jgi:hypothetical protein